MGFFIVVKTIQSGRTYVLPDSWFCASTKKCSLPPKNITLQAKEKTQIESSWIQRQAELMSNEVFGMFS